MPRIVPAAGPLPAAAGLTDLPDGVPVTAVLTDSHAALSADGGKGIGEVKATYGTGSSVMGLSAAGDVVASTLCRTVAWASDRVHFAVEGNIRSSGSTLSWFADLVSRTPQRSPTLLPRPTATASTSYGIHRPRRSLVGRRRASRIDRLAFGTSLPRLAPARGVDGVSGSRMSSPPSTQPPALSTPCPPTAAPRRTPA